MIEVAAAVILSPDGKMLLGRRPDGKPYPGYWEFPGGKIEPGESARAALCRELREELGIEATVVYPWISRTFHYTHATVRLHFFKVYEWAGEPRPLENQALSWQDPGRVEVSPLLPANVPILFDLNLPPIYAITDAAGLGIERQLERLEIALEAGLKLIQVREAAMPREQLRDFSRLAAQLAKQHGAKLLINSDIELAAECGADGVHLNSRQLAELDSRPDFQLVAASTHDAGELEKAIRLGLDFAVLGPVQPTQSHPGKPGIGWERFGRLVGELPIPVYALGGLSAGDLQLAMAHGAHGVALLRGAWV